MQPLAYIQSDCEGQPYSVHGAVAAKGFRLLGYSVIFFTPDELPHLLISPVTPVVGGMGTVQAALRQLGFLPPIHPSVPDSLKTYLGRECWRTHLRGLREAGRFPVFIKPFDEAKLFNGHVIQNSQGLDRLLLPRVGFPQLTDETPILAQEPIRLLSEWRIFVIRQEVVGTSFYQGDPLIFPAGHLIRQALAEYTDAPAGYSADFGVTDDQRTVLIETNDGYSLGHGGLTAALYAELLLARWQEMTAAQ